MRRVAGRADCRMGLKLTVDQIFESGTIKKRLSMPELIDYRYIREAQQK
jgi:hypothetical protein